jgi:hypothetical protein
MKKMWDVHKSNRGRTKTLKDSTRKRHKKKDSAGFVTNPNCAKGPDKGNIVSKLYCILLTTLEFFLIIIFLEKNQT